MSETEWTRTYQLDDGRAVIIELDECLEWISVKKESGKEIGRIEFSIIEYPDHDEHKIVWMYMDLDDSSYKRKGIGRACLKFFNECSLELPTASDNDGIRQDDGSHLTQDAPAFVQKMREEGLIAKSRFDF